MYKSVRTDNAFSSFYVEYESNSGKGKTQSIEEYINEIRPYWSNMTKNLKTRGKKKVQLTIAINPNKPGLFEGSSSAGISLTLLHVSRKTNLI